MDHLRGAARGPDRPVGALDDRDRVATRGGVERHACAGHAAADDDDVERLRRQRASRASARGRSSVEVADGRLDRRAVGRSLLLDRMAEMEQADEVLVGRAGRRPSRPAAVRRTPGRAPVAGQAAGVRGQQHDVGRAGGGVQVLLGDRRGRRSGSPSRRRGSAPGRASEPLPARPRPSAARAPRDRRRESATGCVRWWLGAQCASSKSSSSVARSTAPGR